MVRIHSVKCVGCRTAFAMCESLTVTQHQQQQASHEKKGMSVPPVNKPIHHRRGGSLPNRGHVLILSLVLNFFLAMALLVVTGQWVLEGSLGWGVRGQPSALQSVKMRWHGGHPSDDKVGSCWCGADVYCMCTPSVAIDLVVLSGNDHFWAVRRKDTSQLATVGGFVKMGESVENAVLRELEEETGITNLPIPPKFFGVYSDPRRDNRRHTVSAAYAIHLDGNEKPVANDDVKDVIRIPLAAIEKYDYFSDHKTILLDYRRLMRDEGLKATDFRASLGDFAGNIQRSVCTAIGEQ